MMISQYPRLLFILVYNSLKKIKTLFLNQLKYILPLSKYNRHLAVCYENFKYASRNVCPKFIGTNGTFQHIILHISIN